MGVRFALFFVAASMIMMTSPGVTLAQTQASPRQVEIRAADGVILKGSYSSPAAAGPAVLLFHQCNMDRKSWDSLAPMLARAGFHVLAYDHRGFGESGGAKWKWGGSLDEAFAEWRNKWGPDSEAAFSWLAAQPGVDRNNVAVVGASCGVFMALLFAQHHPSQTNAAVLLSGPADQELKSFLAGAKDLPIFGAASQEDTAAAASNAEYKSLSKDAKSKFEEFDQAGHGAAMFAKEPQLQREIVDWLVSVVRPAPAQQDRPQCDTPAAQEFCAWLAAFNRGEPEGLRAYFEKNYPARLAQIEQEFALQRGTHGFDFKETEESTPAKFTAIIAERSTGIVVRCVMEVDDGPEHHVKNMDLKAVPKP